MAIENTFGVSGRAVIQKRLINLADIPSNGTLAMYASDTDITKNIGGVSWKNSIYELATMLTFETAKTDNAYLKDLIYTPKLGEVIRIVTNVEVFRGVVIKVDNGDKKKNKYTAVDMGWYLNKTSQTYQFNNITVKDAIKEICSDLSIPVDDIYELTTKVTQIYFDKTVSDIIKDLLEKCNGNYNYDFTPKGLRVYKIGNLIAYPEFRLASNLAQGYSVNFRGNVNHLESIEDMKNSIKVVSEKDNVYTELMVLQNSDLIDEYGFLQSVVKIDTEKENADIVANSELWWNGRTKETYSFEIIEKYDSYTRAGEIISVDGVNYVIESTEHRLSNGWHFNKMELRKYLYL